MPPELFVHADVIRRLAQVPTRPYEVGGWLLGYWDEQEAALFVTHATPPASRGTPLGVHISGQGHRKKFDAAYDASGGLVTFLGDWHTHPGSPPFPSQTDERALSRLATDPAYGTPQPLIAIMSTPRWPCQRGDVQLAFYVRTRDETTVGVRAEVLDDLPQAAQAVPSWDWPERRASRRHAARPPAGPTL